MIPHIQSFDEFFPPYEFDLLRSYALNLEYHDEVAPFDGVTYKHIGTPVPGVALEHMVYAISWVVGYRVIPKYPVFRFSPEGSKPPQWAHSDAEMPCKFNFIMYLNNGPGGTALVEHVETGMSTHPKDEIELAAWKRDYNETGAWKVRSLVGCEPNRAVLIRSDAMHAAIPYNGFGSTLEDGRLILLCFFD